uniref:Histone acetyltransferase n=1 Tax=Gongylonema pulchrum TaxID=637853 RepID=A0A183CVM5_9BILA
LSDTVLPQMPKSGTRKKPARSRGDGNEEEKHEVEQMAPGTSGRMPTRRSTRSIVLSQNSVNKTPQKKDAKQLVASSPKQQQLRRSLRCSAPSTVLPPSASTDAPRTRSARVNSRECQTTSDRQSREMSSLDVGTSSTAETAEKSIADIVLDKSVIERYCKRMEAVRRSARKSDKNEIFYGRCTSRRNLFDDDSSEEGSVRVATRSASCIQKNRSGRSVKTNRVYMAHALLNVYNTDPLNPPKPPKEGPFKLHRLIRQASKSDKKRISKFRLRIAREKTGLASTTIPSEASGTASSSQSIQTKSESPEIQLSNGSEKPVKLAKELSDKSSNLSSYSRDSSADIFKEPSFKKPFRKTSKVMKSADTGSEIPSDLVKGGSGDAKREISLESETTSSESSKVAGDVNGDVEGVAKIESLNGKNSSEELQQSSNGDIIKTDGTQSSHSLDSASEKSSGTSSPKRKKARMGSGKREASLTSSAEDSTKMIEKTDEQMDCT